MKRLFYLLIILVLPYKAVAQQPAYFLFGEKEFEGIDIYNLIQDNDHHYWFATDQGIIKHDGYSFKNVECDEMKSSSVFNFVKDKQGTIYCHNLNHQVFRILDGKCELFFEIPEIGKGADIYLKTISQNELIVVSRKAYVVNLKGKVIASTEKVRHDYLGVPYVMKTGSVIFGQSIDSTVLVYKEGKFLKEVLLAPKITSLFNKDEIVDFYKLGYYTYAISSVNKLFFKLNENDFTLERIASPIVRNELDHVRCYSVDNQLWIASGISGLQVLNQQLFPTFSREKLYEEFFISNVYKDFEGNVLLSTFDKGVLVIPNPKMMDVLKDLKGELITRIFSDENQGLYIGTNTGKVLQVNRDQSHVLSPFGNKSIDALYKWRGTPFVLTDNSGFSIINTHDKSIINMRFAFKCATISRSNVLYIGTNIGVGILEYNRSRNTVDYKPIPKLGARTYSIQCDPISNHVYITTADGVKIRYPNGKVGPLKVKGTTVFGSAMGNSDQAIYIVTKKQGVVVVSKGKMIHQFFPKYKNELIKLYKFKIRNNKIYANTSIGLLVLDLNGNVQFLLNKSIGLSTNKVVDFDIHKNTIWVSHSKGVQMINLQKLGLIDKPMLLLSKIEVNNEKIRNKNEFHFSQNKFSFVLQVPTLKNRENSYYYYKLMPTDTNWMINAYDDNRITYNSLGPGTYQFVVKAENNGVFSQPIHYTFTIQRPFYQRWWFIVIVAFLGIAIITLFYRRQLRKQQLKADQLNELNASKLTAIQSQMNPHFIFNSLNSIQDLVLKGDVTNSYTFITKFSNLVRRTLNYSDKDFIDFDQEIKLLELYLSLEKLRFKESLEFTLETNEIDDIQVPPMLIQPFIENALLHGLLHKEGMKKLKIEFKLEETLICEITDNGIGRKKSKEIKERQRSEHESFAIGAIKKRFEILEKHFEGELGFEYIDLKEGEAILGTKVILKIPIKHKF